MPATKTKTARATPPPSDDQRSTDLYDVITLEQDNVIALAMFLSEVFSAANGDDDAINLNNLADGLRVVAETIDDKVQAMAEHTERLYGLQDGAR